MAAMAHPVEEKMLHMVTADAARTPAFTFFGNPDFFFQTVGSAAPTPGPGFAWNHGDIQPEIARTFIGILGPRVAKLPLQRTCARMKDSEALFPRDHGQWSMATFRSASSQSKSRCFPSALAVHDAASEHRRA